MRFENSFEVDAPAAAVWQTLMDFERVAPCMPGAELLEQVGDDAYKVRVRVKVGPMSITYRGQVEITERNEDARSAAMRVQAREARGQGTANATVQLRLAEEGAGTQATMGNDLKVSGRAASMGRGVMVDVAQALVAQFAENLAGMLGEQDTGTRSAEPAANAPEPTAVGATASADSPRPAVSRAAEGHGPPQLDVGDVAKSVILNRLRESPARAGAGALVVVLLLVLLRRGRSRSG